MLQFMRPFTYRNNPIYFFDVKGQDLVDILVLNYEYYDQISIFNFVFG